MGAQSTLHVTPQAAQKAFGEVFGEALGQAVVRKLGESGFEKLLDDVLSDSLYNVLLIGQNQMDEAWADYYKRTFGNYDPSGSTLRFELQDQLKNRGLEHVWVCFRRIAAARLSRPPPFG